MEFSFPSPPVAAAAAAAAAADVDHPKVNDGKMHIEKDWVISDADVRAGYIILCWKRKWCREIWMDPTTPERASRRRAHIKNADLGSPLASAVRR